MTISKNDQIAVDPAADERLKAWQDAMADLADLYRSREEAEKAARAEVARIEDAWAAGEDGPTAEDRVKADYELERCTKLREKAGSDLQCQDRRAPVQTLDFAVEVAEHLSDLYDGAKILVTDVEPDGAVRVGNGPVLRIVQKRDIHQEGFGIVSADLELKLYGKIRLISHPPAEVIKELFEERGWIVSVRASEPTKTDGAWVSSVNLTIRRGWYRIPRVVSGKPRYSSENGPRVVNDQVLFTELLDDLKIHLSQTGGDAAQIVPAAGSWTIVSNDGEVIRERFVVPFFLGYGSGGAYTNVEAALDAACAGWVGKLAPGLGLVESFETVPVETRGRQQGVARALTVVRRSGLDEDLDGDEDDDLDDLTPEEREIELEYRSAAKEAQRFVR